MYASGDGDKGLCECPFDFYKTWVNEPLRAQQMVEAITREHVGVQSCPVPGVPHEGMLLAQTKANDHSSLV